MIGWLIRKWRQWFGYYTVGDYVYTHAELQALLGPLNKLTAERAAQARRDYEDFMRRAKRDGLLGGRDEQ